MSFNCIICIDSIRSKDSLVSTKCGHVLHEMCLKSWLMSSQNCPKCRSSITSGEFFKIFLDEDVSIESDLEKAIAIIKGLKEQDSEKTVLLEALKKDVQEKDAHISEMSKKLEILNLLNQSNQARISSLESIIEELTELEIPQ